jgi:hypothetical protein
MEGAISRAFVKNGALPSALTHLHNKGLDNRLNFAIITPHDPLIFEGIQRITTIYGGT